MVEWMGLHAVSSFMRFPEEEALCCTAVDRLGVRSEYLIKTTVDSEEEYDVFVRPINSGEMWEWVDAICDTPPDPVEVYGQR